jgi:hypothetical protein
MRRVPLRISSESHSPCEILEFGHIDLVPALCLGVGDIRKPFGFGRNVKVLLEVDAVRFRFDRH